MMGVVTTMVDVKEVTSDSTGLTVTMVSKDDIQLVVWIPFEKLKEIARALFKTEPHITLEDLKKDYSSGSPDF